MRVAWFSCGCSSFIATYLVRDTLDEVAYIHVTDQEGDTLRFLADAQRLLGREVLVLQSDRFAGVDDVIERRRYINGPGGACCTQELKKRVRTDWEAEFIDEPSTYVWGYDASERHRAERIVETMPEFRHEFPLIERGLTKADVHGMCAELGIKRPRMYDLGYPNNNCVGCVKGGMGYWNAIRRDFPEVFERRARQEREIGHSCIKGVFLDELEPNRGRMDEVFPSCSFACLGLGGE